VLRFILAFLVLIPTAFAQMEFCTKELEAYPTRAGGREKPLYVLADDMISFMTGSSKLNGMSATEAFCKLSLKAFGMPVEIPVDIKVEHVEVRKLLGMDEAQTSIPVQELIGKIDLVTAEMQQIKENNSYKKELSKVSSRLNTYRAIVGAEAWTVPVREGDKIDFLPLAGFLTKERVGSVEGQTSNPVAFLFKKAKEDYIAVNGDKYLLELKYFKWDLFSWGIITSLLGIITLVALKKPTVGFVFTGTSILLQIVAITLRVLISGRAPITNMYETVMFSGFGGLVISLFVYAFRKEIMFVISGLVLNFLCLWMMKFAHGMLDEGISPLVPVLRDNFWLSTHVSTIILSYAALALSWVLANVLMIRTGFKTVPSNEYRYQVDLIYTCLKVGIVLLAAGIILGGVWADYSWGRFWGWDPKETWSLIVLLIYMAILHGKYTNWITPKRFVPMVAGAFMRVMMAWFGVNYILASGLHSYGFSEGGAIFLGSFFLTQTVLIILCIINPKSTAATNA